MNLSAHMRRQTVAHESFCNGHHVPLRPDDSRCTYEGNLMNCWIYASCRLCGHRFVFVTIRVHLKWYRWLVWDLCENSYALLREYRHLPEPYDH
jgi:hypothetical protein